MVVHEKDMLSRTEKNVQNGRGILHIKKMLTLEQMEGIAPVCDVFTLEPGDSIGIHTHTSEAELYYILRGSATVCDNGHMERLNAGDVHYCSEGSSHSIENNSGATMQMLAIVLLHS